jgi:hypothetical protein
LALGLHHASGFRCPGDRLGLARLLDAAVRPAKRRRSAAGDTYRRAGITGGVRRRARRALSNFLVWRKAAMSEPQAREQGPIQHQEILGELRAMRGAIERLERLIAARIEIESTRLAKDVGATSPLRGPLLHIAKMNSAEMVMPGFVAEAILKGSDP